MLIQAALSLFSPSLHVCQPRSVPRLDEAPIWDQRWREQMHTGRKQEPAAHCCYYHSGSTFLMTEDVKEGEGRKKGREVG